MKIILLVLFSFLFFFNVNAQETYRFEFEKECGDPTTESQIYPEWSAKVLKINEDNTIKVKTDKGKKITITLAGIDLAQNKDELNKILTDKLLSKKILYSGNSEKKKPNKIEAIIEIDSFDINRFLIEKGFSKYKNTNYYYSVSTYQLCVYQQLEERAKQAKLGIWAK
jgi:endonuclease YncB( thermonuclease family)